MRVLVSGSLREEDEQQQVDEQRQEHVRTAARELGKHLALAGHTLLVGTDHPNDVDPYVVEGFLAEAKTSHVEVHLMRGAPRPYPGRAGVTPIWHRYNDWDVTVLEVVRYNADAVIVIAGRTGVVHAGIAGWMLGRPTIPFGGFGGGAEKVWEYGSSDRQRFYFGALTDAEIDQLNGPWEDDATGPQIVEHLDRCAEQARRATVPPTLRAGLSAGILVALVAWVTLLVLPFFLWKEGPPAPSTNLPQGPDAARFVLLLAAVCAAGAFGALVQSMRGIREGIAVTAAKAWIDGVLGVAAGFLTAVLYMLAQIAISGTLVLPADNKNYSRVALIVSMTAVFASLYLDAAFSRFDTFKESVMSGTYGKNAGDGSSPGKKPQA